MQSPRSGTLRGVGQGPLQKLILYNLLVVSAELPLLESWGVQQGGGGKGKSIVATPGVQDWYPLSKRLNHVPPAVEKLATSNQVFPVDGARELPDPSSKALGQNYADEVGLRHYEEDHLGVRFDRFELGQEFPEVFKNTARALDPVGFPFPT